MFSWKFAITKIWFIESGIFWLWFCGVYRHQNILLRRPEWSVDPTVKLTCCPTHYYTYYRTYCASIPLPSPSLSLYHTYSWVGLFLVLFLNFTIYALIGLLSCPCRAVWQRQRFSKKSVIIREMNYAWIKRTEAKKKQRGLNFYKFIATYFYANTVY